MRTARAHLATGFLLVAALAMSACVGTREAYREASSPDEYAYVLTEHYSALVKQAADLKEKPSTPARAVLLMQTAELAVRPIILGGNAMGTQGNANTPGLRELASKYQAIHDAQSEAELQRAIDAAVLRIADFVRAINSAEASP